MTRYNVPEGLGGHMERITTSARGAIQAMVTMTGTTKHGAERAAGYSRGFVQLYTGRRVVPGLDVLAKLARACGMRLQVADDADAIIIDSTD